MGARAPVDSTALTKALPLAIAGSAFCLSALTSGFFTPVDTRSGVSPGHPPFFPPYQYSSLAGDTALYAEAYRNASGQSGGKWKGGTIAAGTISHHLFTNCRDIGAERVHVVQHTNSGRLSHNPGVPCTSYINTYISADEKDLHRAAVMNPEDPLVLAWLKALQDRSPAGHRLVPSQEGDDAGQTFNNSIVAIAFMVKHERERAERILDFYAESTVVENRDATLQNFFYKGEARGFYQEASISTRHNAGSGSDRWIGDMAWLLCACKYHEKEYHSERYSHLASLLRDLLVSFYKPSAHGGYIQSGWRRGDTYRHEPNGHHEGNIDCYAVLRLCGEDTLAGNIRVWIDEALRGLPDLPLDLYTWRVLAYGPESAGLLRIPEEDPRYRKTITLRGHSVTGFYDGPDGAQENIWTDGVGHIACAYETCGDAAKGYFYANQLDSMMIERRIDGVMTHALSYTANRSGGYDWVDTTRGFTSCAAWYILAKNGVNPFRPR
jgi:hypothetical protein